MKRYYSKQIANAPDAYQFGVVFKSSFSSNKLKLLCLKFKIINRNVLKTSIKSIYYLFFIFLFLFCHREMYALQSYINYHSALTVFRIYGTYAIFKKLLLHFLFSGAHFRSFYQQRSFSILFLNYV